MPANNTIPALNITYIETHNSTTLCLADISYYPPTWSIVAPTIQITPPSFATKTISFPARTMQIYNSGDLGITCSDSCDPIALSDGIWHITYTINPFNQWYVNKTFIRVNELYEKLDKTYLKLDFMQCDEQIKRQDKELLDTIETYINGAIAAGNNCLEKKAMQLYRKAEIMLSEYLTRKDFLR